MYSSIYGTFTITVPDLSFDVCEMKLSYDPESAYNTGQTISVTLNGLYNNYKREKKTHRIIMRQINFTVSQYFTLTLSSSDKINWNGYLTCILPVDVVNLLDVVCVQKMDSIVDSNEKETENEYDISVTI